MEYLEILNALLKWFTLQQDIGGTPAMATAYLTTNLYGDQPKIKLAIKIFQLFQASGKISLSESLWFLQRNFCDSPLPGLDRTEIAYQINLDLIAKEKKSSVFASHQTPKAKEMAIRCPGCGLPCANFMEFGQHVFVCNGDGCGAPHPNPTAAALELLRETHREEARTRRDEAGTSRAAGSGPIVAVEEAHPGQTGKEPLIESGAEQEKGRTVQEKGPGLGSCADAGGSRTVQDNKGLGASGGSGTVQENTGPGRTMQENAAGGSRTVQDPSGSGLGVCAAGGSRTVQENTGPGRTVQENAAGGSRTVQDPSGSGPVPRFECQKCGRIFPNQKAVNGHQLRHRNEALKGALGQNPNTGA